MWELLAHLLHMLIVAALSLVGVTFHQDSDIETQDARLDSVVSYTIPGAGAPECRVPLVFLDDAFVTPVLSHPGACVTPRAEPLARSGRHLPAFIERDELAS